MTSRVGLVTKMKRVIWLHTVLKDELFEYADGSRTDLKTRAGKICSKA